MFLSTVEEQEHAISIVNYSTETSAYGCRGMISCLENVSSMPFCKEIFEPRMLSVFWRHSAVYNFRLPNLKVRLAFGG